MTNSKKLFHDLLSKLTLPDKEEAIAILYILLEYKTGLTRQEIMTGKEIDFTEDLQPYLSRINRHEPIQYITGEAYFRERKFYVTPDVLIPRPETELLVQCVLDEGKNNASILDVGTGSGCIAISLALDTPHATVYSVDISSEALMIAHKNAETLKARVNFFCMDFLTSESPVGELDFIVSNPPYVRESEKKTMEPNVLHYEPHLALFVTDDNPLIFYEALARQGKKILKGGGKVMAEINPQLDRQTPKLFEDFGYSKVTVRHDLEGKKRIVIAEK